MTLADIEKGLEQIRGLAVVQREQARNMVMLSNDIAFLDTCMFAHHYSCINIDIWIDTIRKMCSDKTIFLITPLLLYEMQGGADRELSREQIVYLEKLCKAGVKLAYLPEEECIRAIHQKYREEQSLINKHICSAMKKIAIKFPSVGDTIKNDASTVKEYIFGVVKPSKQDAFLDTLFAELRKSKQPKDSLAEELIAIISLYLLEVTALEMNYQIRLFTDDINATMQLAISPLSEYAKQSKFRTINSVGLLTTMDVQHIFMNVEELASVLKKIRENFKQIGIREDGYDMYIHDSLGYQKVAQAIWDNKVVIFPCVKVR